MCVYLNAMSTIGQHSLLFGNSNLSALLLTLLSSACFIISWPALGGLPIFVFFAFVPLFYLSQLELTQQITLNELKWFTAAAFFTWNLSAVSFLFYLEAPLGIRLLSVFTPVAINTLWMTAAMMLFTWALKRSGVGWGSVLFVAAWLSFEWVQLHWPLAFPWLNLGHVFASTINWVQWYAYTGVAGGSLLVLCVNVLIGIGLFHLRSKRARSMAIGLLALLLTAPVVYRQFMAQQREEPQRKLAFTAVQPCAGMGNQTEKNQSAVFRLAAADQLIDNREAANSIVVFPETYLYERPVIAGPLDSLRFSGLWVSHIDQSKSVELLREMMGRGQWRGVVAGAFTQQFYGPGSSAPGFARPVPDLSASVVSYNTALLLDSTNVVTRFKTKLVPGVEFVPFASSFPFLNDLALQVGGVVGTLGSNPEIRTAQVSGHELGVQICYDSAFGWISRQLANQGGEVLVVITNDSWWGDTPGYKHLLQFAQLRAIEVGMPVVRSANCGVSAVISPRGELVAHVPWGQKGAISAEVEVGRGPTFYTRYGDFIYLVGAAMAVLALLANGIYAHRNSRQ